MSTAAYEPVSGLDHSFLVLESPSTHMHVAVTLILDARPLRRPDGAIDIDRIRAYTASRLHRVPRYRQRLAQLPLQGHPVWIDDAHFNIDYHVRHTSLPRPADAHQLKRLAARIMSQQLDRAKPLWELWVVEGLEGDRFALIVKTHHCMIDGNAAAELLEMMLQPEPIDRIETVVPFEPRPLPSRLDVLREQIVRGVQAPLELARGLRQSLDDPDDLRRELIERARGLADTLAVGMQGTEPTPINGPIGPHRRFDWLEVDSEAVRAIVDRLGGTLDDVVLASVAGALRHFIIQRGQRPKLSRFRVLVPVRLGLREGSDALGNRISNWLVDLPIGERDPRRRLEAIRARTAEFRGSAPARAARQLTQETEWSGCRLLSLGAQALTRSRPFNLVVTHVPGPQAPLYLLGSELLQVYPQVPLFKEQGAGIALFSYAGRLFWGINADWDLVPDVALLTDALAASLNELASVSARRRRPRRARSAERGRDRSASASP